MNHRELKFARFGTPEDPLTKLPQTQQVCYLRGYLKDLGVKTVVEEPDYFDRDYLDEFAAFYAVSARGYSNRCKRLTFFFGPFIEREYWATGVGGDDATQKDLQKRFCGFSVIRPIPSAPLGRTVLRWYPDEKPSTPRIREPSRTYHTHITGIALTVEGLAWEQQDTGGVGECATVALWSMLHSSAFDDQYAIPTTVQVAHIANRVELIGARLAPSSGLTPSQIAGVIRAHGLAAIVYPGDLKYGSHGAFSRSLFSTFLGLFIRSGYPVLVGGILEGGEPHAICLVGFRETSLEDLPSETAEFQDEKLDYVFVHDDNIGPKSRFQVLGVRLSIDSGDVALSGKRTPRSGRDKPAQSDPPIHHMAILQLSKPSGRGDYPESCAKKKYPQFRPTTVIAAVHHGIRLDPRVLMDTALSIGKAFAKTLSEAGDTHSGGQLPGVTIAVRFIRLHKYLGDMLAKMLSHNPSILTRVRMQLTEGVPPMSLNLALVRIVCGQMPMVDILYDTTESGLPITCFCHIAYRPEGEMVMRVLETALSTEIGILIKAFDEHAV